MVVDILHLKCKIQAFQKHMKSAAMPGYVVHPGDIPLPLGPGVTALPFADL